MIRLALLSTTTSGSSISSPAPSTDRDSPETCILLTLSCLCTLLARPVRLNHRLALAINSQTRSDYGNILQVWAAITTCKDVIAECTPLSRRTTGLSVSPMALSYFALVANILPVVLRKA